MKPVLLVTSGKRREASVSRAAAARFVAAPKAAHPGRGEIIRAWTAA